MSGVFLGMHFQTCKTQLAIRKPRSLPWLNRDPPKIGKKAFEKDDADGDDADDDDDDDDDGMQRIFTIATAGNGACWCATQQILTVHFDLMLLR